MRRLAGSAALRTAVAGVALLLSLGVAAAEKTATASARLAEAKAAAASWQKDASLVTVSALQAADDGTAPLNVAGWNYTFHSKSAKKWAGFHVGPKGLERTELPAGLTEPVPTSFVDSDKVLAEVRKHGFKKQGDTLLILMVQRDKNLKTGAYWCAASAADVSPDQGMRGYCVDPGTGRFVARMAGATARAPSQSSAAKGTSAGGVLAGFDPAQCGGFTAADAAAILKVPASSLSRRAEQAGGAWTCTFGSGGKQVVFSLSVAKGAPEAAAEMERYRRSLKDQYSDIMGLADEGLWTETTKTATFRKQNVTVKVQQPPEKMPQLHVVKALFDRR